MEEEEESGEPLNMHTNSLAFFFALLNNQLHLRNFNFHADIDEDDEEHDFATDGEGFSDEVLSFDEEEEEELEYPRIPDTTGNVYILTCKGCMVDVCHRAMQVHLVANSTVQLFSSDQEPR